MKEYKTFVGLNLPISIVEKIDDFKTRNRLKSRSDSISQLVQLSLYIESKIGLVETISSEEVQTIREQIETGQIVDYFAHMDHRKFSLLINIVKDEEKARYGIIKK